MSLPIIAIIGRPNVGKSTLFNRIIRRRDAIVDPTPGVTRDRNYAEAEWAGTGFILVDTGGYMPKNVDDKFAEAVSEQTLIAAEEADLVIFLTDASSSTVEIESELARTFLRTGVKVVLAANKIDDPTKVGLAWAMSSLGLGEPQPISALNGFQVGDLLEVVINKLGEIDRVDQIDDEDTLSLAVIGAPNNGKSSFVNRLCGEERMVVSDIPGTTRDAVDTIIEYDNRKIRLIDTAGLRRKRFGEKGLDFYCTLRSLKALDRADIAVVMIDGEMGFTQGDIRLVEQAVKSKVGIIVAVNKWDLVPVDPKSGDDWLEEWRFKVPSLQWVPVYFISALTGRRVTKILDSAITVEDDLKKRISTSILNEKLIPQLMRNQPPSIKGKNIRIKYAAQILSSPPRFAIFASHAELVKAPYKRFVENQIRELFGFRGVPVSVVFREK